MIKNQDENLKVKNKTSKTITLKKLSWKKWGKSIFNSDFIDLQFGYHTQPSVFSVFSVRDYYRVTGFGYLCLRERLRWETEKQRNFPWVSLPCLFLSSAPGTSLPWELEDTQAEHEMAAAKIQEGCEENIYSPFSWLSTGVPKPSQKELPILAHTHTKSTFIIKNHQTEVTRNEKL